MGLIYIFDPKSNIFTISLTILKLGTKVSRQDKKNRNFSFIKSPNLFAKKWKSKIAIITSTIEHSHDDRTLTLNWLAG
jgi:hypothetical protein